MYEFMKETVILTAFMCIMALDAFAAGYWILRFIKWVKKARRREQEDSE